MYLKPAAKPLLARLSELGADMMETVLEGLDAKSIDRMLKELGTLKDNLRRAISANAHPQEAVNG